MVPEATRRMARKRGKDPVENRQHARYVRAGFSGFVGTRVRGYTCNDTLDQTRVALKQGSGEFAQQACRISAGQAV